MKKLIALTILLIFGIAGNVFADDAQRQTSQYISTGDVTEVKSSAGKVFSITSIATSNGGWVAVYDSSSSTISGLSPKIEIMEATQNNTGRKEFPEGLKFHKGIYVERSNAKIIVYYH